MVHPDQEPIALELDEEFVDEWAVMSMFSLIGMSMEQIANLMDRVPDGDGRSGLDIFGSHGRPNVAMLCDENVRGTQRGALELLAVRYKAILGNFAVSSSVIESSMSLQTVVDMSDGSKPPALDVTPHLKRILAEYDAVIKSSP